MRVRPVASAMLGILWTGFLCAADISFPPPPRLATSAAEWKQRQAKPGFDAKVEAAKQQGDRWLKEPVEIPKEWGNWIFYYACPADGTDLQPLSAAEHRCPRCKQTYQDERTQQAYRTVLHNRANRAALDLGWAYLHTGQDEYAREVQRILLTYADAYAGFPARRDRWGREGWLAPLGGRRYCQSLSEAVGVIDLAKAYDLTRSSPVWNDQQRKHVEADFFRATANTLLWWNQGRNNHQTWYNAGLLAIASVLEDAELVHKVLDMRGGYHDQLKKSIGDDGLWYEGSMAYHHYALQAMLELVDAGRRLGLPLHDEPRLKSMFSGPLAYAYPNGQFPAINDSDPSHLNSLRPRFLWAWQTYHDPLFAHAYADGNPKLLAELLGTSTPAAAVPSADLTASGLAVLRRGTGTNAVCAMLDYGPHGGGHGHPDKLNLMIYAAGREWLLDPGRLSYSHREHQTWYRQTVAHNTVTLNGQSQFPTTGQRLWFKSHDHYAAFAAEASTAYAGAALRRYLLLTDSFLIDLTEVEAKKAATIDLLAHAVCDRLKPVTDLPAGVEVQAGTKNGYEHLSQGRSWKVQGNTVWDFEAGEKRLRMFLAGPADEEIISSIGLGYNTSQAAPCLLRRVQTDQVRWLTVYDLTGTASHVRSVQMSKEAPHSISIDTDEGKWRCRFSTTGVEFEKQ